MNDPILADFLDTQLAQGRALAAESDLFALHPLDGPQPQRYVATFSCTGLVRTDSGAVDAADRFAVGIWFPDDYLRLVHPFSVLTWMGPLHVFHPNISFRAPFVCTGVIAPATPLVDLIYRCFEIITYQRVTMNDYDALNREACAWARRHQDRLPIDPRPLKRQQVSLDDLVLVEESL